MKLRLLSFTMLAIGCLSNGATADVSGGPVFFGGEGYVRCMVFNAGPGNATITGNEITTGGVPIDLDFDSCGTTLRAGKLCVIGGPAAAVAHSCRIQASGGVLRGVIAVYQGNFVRHSSDLR